MYYTDYLNRIYKTKSVKMKTIVIGKMIVNNKHLPSTATISSF